MSVMFAAAVASVFLRYKSTKFFKIYTGDLLKYPPLINFANINKILIVLGILYCFVYFWFFFVVFRLSIHTQQQISRPYTMRAIFILTAGESCWSEMSTGLCF